MTAPGEESTHIRLTVLVVVVACLFAALFSRLWFLQIINAPKAQAAAEDNGVKIIYIPAPRGQILDRNGLPLVSNRESQVIEVNRQVAARDPMMVSRLSALLGMTPKQLDTAINNLSYSPYAPVPVLPDASEQEILYVEENQSLFPGVQATTEAVRSYSAAGAAAANVVGYVGQINATEYSALRSKGYQAGDLIGKTGVEASYESALRGQPGVEKVQVDSQGNVLTVLSYQPPVQGHDVKLTLDGNVQMAAEVSLEQGLESARKVTDPVTGRKFVAPAGAVVVENPNDGSVLALATDPVYNPNDFVGGISEAKYAAYQNPASNFPLDDRTVDGQYAPGSTFKLITATAGLQYGLITPATVYDDTGGLKVGNQFFSNDNHASYGRVDLQTAITVSSDAYFYSIGANLYLGAHQYGVDALQNVARAYGLGSPTGVALTGEASGNVPDPAEVKKEHTQYPSAYPNGTWYEGDEVQTAVGEEQDLVTPLQLANAYAAFSNGGTLWTPRIAIDAQSQSGQVLDSYAARQIRQIPLPAADRAAMLAGFMGVTANPRGTAYADFRGFSVPVGGKTGTAQVGTGDKHASTYKQNTSVFASFAPATAPQYVVDCFMEQSGYGADSAAPVVRQIYDVLFNQTPAQPVLTNAAGRD